MICSGRQRRSNASTAFPLVGDVIAETFEREEESRPRCGTGSPAARLVGRGRQSLLFGQPLPREQFARIDSWRIGATQDMADHIGAGDVVLFHDPAPAAEAAASICGLARRPVTERVARMIQFDPMLAEFTIRHAPPEGLARMARHGALRAPGG